MGLKESIVVVSEFSVPDGNGGGSRGGTPGEYVTRYMARNLATEQLAPIKQAPTSDYIERYMAREEAVESLDTSSTGDLKRRMRRARGDAGVSFGYGEFSLSHDGLKAASADIQRLFDSGHTVMKTVISFDEGYLKKYNLVPEDFRLRRRGDYRGNLDQLKLRMAVMRGVERMGRALYDDLRYVGVIQVDTKHVHCHLAMVDAGEGKRAADGSQVGKLSRKGMAFIRRGIDSWLDEKQTVARLSSAVGYERRNVITFIKRWAHKQVVRESLPQLLLAALPADRRLWRASTNRREMAKPNRIVRELVEDVLAQPGSPMGEAMAKVRAYARERMDSEGLTAKQWSGLVEQGRERIVERGMNAVYASLRQLPEDALSVRTPLLDVMGMDYEELLERSKARTDEEDDLVGFSFRLRSYSARLEEHLEARAEALAEARAWEAANEEGSASEASRALYEWYLAEEDYRARCASKYRHFLPVSQSMPGWEERWVEVSEQSEAILSLESMAADSSLRRMKDPAEAEAIGREVYGQRGGALVCTGDAAALADRAGRMRATRDRMVSDLRADLAAHGLSLRVAEDGTGSAEAGEEFPFEETKALDLHRLRYDFSSDAPVGMRSRDVFVAAARRREEALLAALEYLHASGQPEVAESLPVDDVRAMGAMARRLESEAEPVLPSEVAAFVASQKRARRSATVRLGTGLAEAVEQGIEEGVRSAVPELIKDLEPGHAFGQME